MDTENSIQLEFLDSDFTQKLEDSLDSAENIAEIEESSSTEMITMDSKNVDVDENIEEEDISETRDYEIEDENESANKKEKIDDDDEIERNKLEEELEEQNSEGDNQEGEEEDLEEQVHENKTERRRFQHPPLPEGSKPVSLLDLNFTSPPPEYIKKYGNGFDQFDEIKPLKLMNPNPKQQQQQPKPLMQNTNFPYHHNQHHHSRHQNQDSKNNYEFMNPYQQWALYSNKSPSNTNIDWANSHSHQSQNNKGFVFGTREYAIPKHKNLMKTDDNTASYRRHGGGGGGGNYSYSSASTSAYNSAYYGHGQQQGSGSSYDNFGRNKVRGPSATPNNNSSSNNNGRMKPYIRHQQPQSHNFSSIPKNIPSLFDIQPPQSWNY